MLNLHCYMLNQHYDNSFGCLRLGFCCIRRANVGISGAEMTVFYTEVTDEMKVSKGGGQESEGEMIEVCELPVKGCLAYFMQPNIVKPIGLLTTLMWFHIYKQQIL